MTAVEMGAVGRERWRLDAARVRRMAGFAGLFALSALVGRATIVDGRTLSLVWPAAGVAVLWFLSERVRAGSADVAVLAGTTYAVYLVAGSEGPEAMVFTASTVVQTMAVVWLYQRWGADTREQGEPLSSTRSLVGLVAAALAGCVAGTLLGVVGLWSTDDFFSVASTLTWWGRNAVGVIGVTIAGLLLLDARTRPLGPARDRRQSRGWWIELGSVVAVTGLLYGIELLPSVAPVSFLLPGVLVWVGMRFAPVLAALHGLIAGACFVAVTLSGNGPFAGVESVRYAALLSQLFVAICVVAGMMVAIYRTQTHRLLSDVRHAREASDDQADVLGTVIASMDDGLCVVDPGGVVQMCNPALERLLGVSVEPGTPVAEALTVRGLQGALVSAAELPTSRALAGEVVPGVDCVVDSSAGERLVSVSATPLGEAGDRGAVVVMRDVTEERAHQRELSGFAGVVAHDLLNPIGTVDGWAEALEDAVADGEQPADPELELQMVRKIRGAAGRMRSLVRDLLAHATSADRTLAPEALDLAEMAADVALDRGVADHVWVGDVPPVEVDPVLARQLLNNLIGNSVKYVVPGAAPDIEVTGEAVPGEAVRVTIADRGIGIPDGQHDIVFGDFERAHAADYQGTGLGLAICRRIVERHGGGVAARPREGGGTSMVLTLPAAVGIGPPSGQPEFRSAREPVDAWG